MTVFEGRSPSDGLVLGDMICGTRGETSWNGEGELGLWIALSAGQTRSK